LVSLASALLVVGACGGSRGDTTTTVVESTTTTTVAPMTATTDATTTPEAILDGELVVSAAASLTDAFAQVEAAFEAANPGVDVALNLGSSSSLREQILEGAPADVFASANTSNMDQLVEAGEVEGEAEIFVLNLLQIAVPAGNPAGVTGLDDFANEDLLIGLCAEEVPCGSFGREALEQAGVTPAIDTNEPDVRALLTKVGVGELDAGIVYLTDVLSTAGAVEGVEIPDEFNVVAAYPIAALVNAPNSEAAVAFVEFVLSDQGQAILVGFGFSSP
jgi:molybdate transport system substrate-binding protein